MVSISRDYINPFTEYGKKVQVRLVELGARQSWLIEEIKKESEMFVDSSLLNKVLTGRINSPRIVSTINKILSIGDDESTDSGEV